MPKNKSAVSRHRIIDKCINDRLRPYPTKESLARKCSEILNTDVSPSTIEKDIAAMKEPGPAGYDAPIVYSKQNKGYVYSEKGFSISELNLQDEEWEGLNFAAQLLYQYKDVPVFANFKHAIERINARFSLGFTPDDPIINKSVQFEQAVATRGMEWINVIYEAIQHKYAIMFTYANIYKKETKDYILTPYLLKEHRNRWYVIGWREDKKQYVTFGLDRISGLDIIQEKQKHRPDFNADNFFQYATGIMDGTGKPAEVLLTIKHPVSQLVLLEPLHQSQKLVSENAGQIKVSVLVYVNEEFYLKLLSMGSGCIVNKPASLRNKMKGIIETMGLNYR